MRPTRYHPALVVLHWLLALLLIVALTMGTLVLSNLPNSSPDVFAGTGTLPASFDALAPRAVHGLAAMLLMALIALHVAAALYHHFVRRDGLIGRMGIGPSTR
jgi:cytochrome b561